MIAGLSGSLLSHDALERLELADDRSFAAAAAAARIAQRRLRTWHAQVRERVGPASGSRVVFDLVAEPLARDLGFTVIPIGGGPDTIDALLHAGGTPVLVMIVTGWDTQSPATWRQAVRRGLAHGCRWCLCVSGRSARLVDVERAYGRRHAEFDLGATIDNERSFAIFWTLLHAQPAVSASTPTPLDTIVSLCERYRAEVRSSLREGVKAALLRLVTAFRAVAARRHPHAQILDESLTVIYRILFLLFAEARGLVPAWHPVFRDAYTIETLRRTVQPPGDATGVWETLQAIARLAHRGCRAGALRVPPFNGRLFSPSDAPLADRLPLGDHAVAAVITALTTRKGHSGVVPISYADLGVEQLGSVYEHLLDYDLTAAARGAPALIGSGRRKATGSFYTPRSLTNFIVRRALAPLVEEATPEQVLALRVVDPAMGSGAFLVGACRYLAGAYERALIREGALALADITEEDRAAFRRVVAQRCLFGVDANPMAVQLGRLSLWLATLASDKPLTFLDHRLRAGNSLIGAAVADVMCRPPGRGAGSLRELPLFDEESLRASVGLAVGSRQSMAWTPDDTLEQVRGKERALSELNRRWAPMGRWKAAADLWCAASFPTAGARARTAFGALLDDVVRGAGVLPGHVVDPLLEDVRSLAATQRFFHWTLEFPEVFHDAAGVVSPDGGFDVVVGNPPWEVLQKPKKGEGENVAELRAFIRTAGLYPMQGKGHGNLYQAFLERALGLLRPGGRLGLIVPGGFGADQAAGALRARMIERCTIDTYTILDNRDAIFPIHRGVKFLLLTLTNTNKTSEIPARSGVRSAEALDRIPDTGIDAGAVRIPRALLERVGGESLAIPDIRAPADLEILSAMAFRAPALAAPDGWGVHFARELNASDDRPHFRSDGIGLPVLEGKQLRPFGVDLGASRHTITRSAAARLLAPGLTFERSRLAYRDVASASNRTTLIAAVLPAGVVTTHTIFCLKDLIEDDGQEFLCGVFNSFVANYLVRLWVSTHVTAGIVARLPVPKPAPASVLFRRIVLLSREMGQSGVSDERMARLNARVAALYELSARQFEHVLDTFPLVPISQRSAAFEAFIQDPG